MTDDNKKDKVELLDDGFESDPERVDYPRRTHQEEYSAEVAPTGTFQSSRGDREADRDDTAGDTGTAGRTVGYVGVGLGIASFFIWSIILGPLAAIMGFYAYSQGNRTSGAWAIGLGAIATLSYFFLMPFTR
ncbi:hypothetical protein [Paenibacillus lentus]|uniref:DUF4190 domain-containing protein n=1 Tax=Paenibacillus lentus TaxID=1338368 RepID=A0A3S8RV42_9BACL|nr:hypothetical protein [Paenibacillus lentus]AZK46856.1 hypothetical protein EIM92_12415 [Paenibacillus lentus]